MTLDASIRQPVQVLEIQFPRCGNSYGCGLCTAGLGTTFSDGSLAVNFARDGAGGYVANNGVFVRSGSGMRFTGNAESAFVQATGSGFSGTTYRYVVVCGVYHGGNLDTWEVSYDNGGGYQAGQKMRPQNISAQFRGNVISQLKSGEMFTAVFDASDSDDFDTAWNGQTITGLRFQIGSGSDEDFTLYSVEVCTDNLFSNVGAECFNTRSTCQDLDNYLEEPWGVELFDNQYLDGDTIPNADITNNDNAFFVVKASFETTPTGTLIWVGGDGNNPFTYLGITDNKLVFRAGVDASVSSAFSRVEVDISEVAGKTLGIIGEINYDDGIVALWSFDFVTRILKKLGEDDGGLAGIWAAATDGLVGDDPNYTNTVETGGDFNGKIFYANHYSSKFFVGREDMQLAVNTYFSKKEINRPLDYRLRIMTMLTDISTIGTRINISSSNENYDPLGGRAILEFSMEDAIATDRDVDPYYSDRPYRVENGDRGLFWERARERELYGRTGALTRLYDGFSDERLQDMRQRLYVLDEISFGNTSSVSFTCRDILSRAELEKVQVPAPSVGELDADITDVATSMVSTGHNIDEYPATGGTVRINDEVITYSGIVDNLDGTFTWTITARGSDGSQNAEHSDGDNIQLCRRYTSTAVDEIIKDILGNDAGIEYQFLNISGWDFETTEYLAAYSLDALITTPEGATDLIGEIAEQCSMYLWWDERDQVVDMKAIRALTEDPSLLDDNDNFVRSSLSFRERPRDRVSGVVISYNPADRTKAIDDDTNYENFYADISDNPYRDAQIRTIRSRWLPTAAQAVQTASRLKERYQDAPIEISFAMDSKDRSLWVGDIISVATSRLRDPKGNAETDKFFIIIEAEERISDGLIAFKAEDATLAGFVSLIAPDAQGDYTGEGSIDGFYGFITDNNGRNADGTEGSKIT
jgi:hypothetical protein